MEIASRIRLAVDDVARIRATQTADPLRLQAVSAIKSLQHRRFAGMYADLLATEPSRSAARFFLDELYGTADFSRRDHQFQRIAGAIESLFPQSVGECAAALAELHALTERLDDAMAQHGLDTGRAAFSTATDYVQAWRTACGPSERARQLRGVMSLGDDLIRFTRTPGLRSLLRMMRSPAKAAGLDDLQRFLENGFDTFARLGHRPDGQRHFLATIQARETVLMQQLFEAPVTEAACALDAYLG